MSSDPKQGEPTDTVEQPAEAEGPGDPAAQIEALSAEKAELYDRLLRRQAEFENFRRRADREKEDIREFAAMEVIREILPVMDDFERALAVECADKDFSRGMELIYQRLTESLQKLGLERIAAEGQKFDPYVHHALEMEETDEVKDHTVLAELLKGYSFRGKLLRPSMVKVAVTPSSPD